MSGWWPYVAALIPSVGVGVLFWVVIKNMIEGDRKERLAHSQWEAEQERKARAQQAQGSESTDNESLGNAARNTESDSSGSESQRPATGPGRTKHDS